MQRWKSPFNINEVVRSHKSIVIDRRPGKPERKTALRRPQARRVRMVHLKRLDGLDSSGSG